MTRGVIGAEEFANYIDTTFAPASGWKAWPT